MKLISMISKIGNGILFLLFISFSSFLGAQNFNLGTPIISNFSKQTYNGATQSWDAAYGVNDHIFFANNDGLLSYDGKTWEIFSLPNKTIVRSLAIADERIYVGGQDEIGYFEVVEGGQLKYHSIIDQIPLAYNNLSDIWDIEINEEMIFFRTTDKIYQHNRDSFLVYQTGNPISALGKFNNRILFADLHQGLFEIQNEKYTFLNGTEILKDKAISKMLELSENLLLICTERNGIYAYDGNKCQKWSEVNTQFFEKNRISSACKINEDQIGIGTLLNGVVILNTKGDAIYHIPKEKGIQNNSISTMCTDNSGNLWLGTYNGIDQIKMGVSISKILPDGNLEGAVYDVAIWNDHIYFGTINGLYYLPWKEYYNPFEKEDFKLIPKTAGQVWGLDVIDDQLFLGHNDGAFQITKDHQAIKMGEASGAWKFISLNKETIVSGNYVGLNLYKKEDDRWKHEKTYEAFKESSRILTLDKFQNLWVAHPYRGIFKIDFSDDFQSIEVEKITSKSIGRPLASYVFDIDDETYVTNEENILAYNYNNNQLESNNTLSNILKENSGVKRLFEDGEEHIWYITSTQTGELIFDNKNEFKQIVYPEISDVFVGGFENLIPYSNQHIFACTEKGVLHFNKLKSRQTHQLKANISSVHSLKPIDTLLHSGYRHTQQIPDLEADQNEVRFTFSTDNFVDPLNITYSFKLEGLDKDWSQWSELNSKEYTNLNNGDYSFLLKAKDHFGIVSEVTHFDFHIQAPWYKTTLAYLIYTLIGFCIIMAMLLIPRKLHQEETAQLIEDKKEKEAEVKIKEAEVKEKEAEVKKKEAEVEKLKYEKLQSEIDFKNKELASSTMHLLQKNSTLNKVREDIEKIQKRLQSDEAKKEIRKVLSVLKDDERLEEDWENFSYHFDQVHSNFIKRLKLDYPNLTPKDQKLCAYLRMNLSTKEIAPLLNISVRGVEISRYRLRKKLALAKEANLSEFMMGF